MSELSLQQYVAFVEKSGLLSSEEVRTQFEAYRSAPSADSEAKSVEGFAKYLERSGLLTEWQNSNLLKGRHRGLMFGKFRVLHLLGIGGMGHVYLAEDQMLRRRVALKVLPHKRVSSATSRERFLREAQALARLNHDNIVRVFDVDVREDTHYIVMEFVEGTDLAKRVQTQGALSVEQACNYISQVAQGLEHAHRAKLIHRDIKPANLLVDQNEVVKISDLGLALLQLENLTSLTADPTKTIGTADYISPEQALNSRDIDARTDIYSLGCSLYFLLTGRPPFNEGSISQRLLAHQTAEPRDLNAVRSELGLSAISDGVEALCRRMMAKKPEERFASAGEVMQACQSIQPELGIVPAKPIDAAGSAEPSDSSSRPTPMDESSTGSKSSLRRSPKSRRPAWPLIAGASLAFAGFALGVFFIAQNFGGSGNGAGNSNSNSVQSQPEVMPEDPLTEYVAYPGGEVYHFRNCISRQNATKEPRRLRQSEVDSGAYRPCGWCQKIVAREEQ